MGEKTHRPDSCVMIGLVHLVWGPLGPAPLKRFIDSYRRHPAGVEHELLIAWNGTTHESRERLEGELEGIPNRSLIVERAGRDLDVYRDAARTLTHDRLCFVNSHSVILTDDWLTKLDDGLTAVSAGLIGATASWMSMRSDALESYGVPTVYRSLLPGFREVRSIRRLLDLEMLEVSTGEESATAQRRSSSQRAFDRARSSARAFANVPEQILRFPPFPDDHIRTNCFCIERRLMNTLEMPLSRRKLDTWVLESGHKSLTRQVRRAGLRTLVIDRNGNAFDRDRWPESQTFWQGDQAGLLVADNQTRSYESGDLHRRKLLSTLAWGDRAQPVARKESSP